MAEKIKEICFKNFRGLPNYTCILKGKNIAILGGNGKGKSAIVDGIEFFFSGTIGRFHGEGSGNINESEAITNVFTKGIPAIEFSFTPTNETLTRKLGEKNELRPQKTSIQQYISQHPAVESFVLRRYQIQDFINDQDAKRYKKYVKLLGIDAIDEIQNVFIEAEVLTKSTLGIRGYELKILLDRFTDMEDNFTPKNLEEILAKCAQQVEAFGFKNLNCWEQLKPAIEFLDSKRSTANKERINLLQSAIGIFTDNIPIDIESSAKKINEFFGVYKGMKNDSIESQKKEIIEEGFKYFKEHPNIVECPLCEEILHKGYENVFKRLKERYDSLSAIINLEKNINLELERLVFNIQHIITQFERENKLSNVFNDDEKLVHSKLYTMLCSWINEIKEIRSNKLYNELSFPLEFKEVYYIREKVLERITQEKNSLITPDIFKLEKTYNYLKLLYEKKAEIENAQSEVFSNERINQIITYLKESFSNAREYAITKVFNIISERVIDYYNRLHEGVDTDEKSECSKLSLIPTSRAEGGGLKLEIEFFSVVDSCDPRGFLSDGHLDSLGLCVYLASVKEFNPSGTLLVFDDILTSIDKDHRNRVAKLIFEEFEDFQIILTTHDERWFKTIIATAKARGVAKDWIFKTIVKWSKEIGPDYSDYKTSWDRVHDNLDESSYTEIGGPLRTVFEDFIKRTSEKIEQDVKYKQDSRYTSGDFISAGFANNLREKLIIADNKKEEIILDIFTKVFGCDDLVNILCHDNMEIHDVSYPEVKDFVDGLEDLTRLCEESKLIKGL